MMDILRSAPQITRKAAAAFLMLAYNGIATATTYLLPTDGSTLVGDYSIVTPGAGNTLLDLARRYDLGQQEIELANPEANLWVPGDDTPVILPRVFILPPKPWEGIIVNIPQRRLFYFPPTPAGSQPEVITLPVSIGREGWSTPLGKTTVIGKYKDPAWFVPPSIQAEHKEGGEPNFPDYFPPGPNNPMGMLAIRLGLPGIFIHGTNKPWALGARVSHGCIHLYPEDAAKLFPLVQTGLPVRIINEPTPVGYREGHIYIQVYPIIEDYEVPWTLEQHAIAAFARLRDDLYEEGIEVEMLDGERLRRLVEIPSSIASPITPGALGTRKLLEELPVNPHLLPPYGVEANNAKMPDQPRE